MKQILQIYLSFLRIGCLAFGGGYSTLPLMQQEIVRKKKWIAEQELVDFYALSQCIPGVIAVNTATFIGYRQKKIWGSIAATLGVITPSLIFMLTLAILLKNFAHIPIVKHALSGIRISVCVIIINAIIQMWKTAVVDLLSACIFFVTGIFCITLHGMTIYFLLFAALLGIVTKVWLVKRKEKP